MLNMLLVFLALSFKVLASAECNQVMEKLGACTLSTEDHQLTVFEEIFEDISECGLGQTADVSKHNYHAARVHCKKVNTAIPSEDECQDCRAAVDMTVCESIFFEQDTHVIESLVPQCKDHCLARVLNQCPPTSFWLDCDSCRAGFKADGGCEPATNEHDIDDMLTTAYACGVRCDVVSACGEDMEDSKDFVLQSVVPSASSENDDPDAGEVKVGSSGPCSGVKEVEEQSSSGVNALVGVSSALLGGASVVGATAKGANLAVAKSGAAAMGITMKMSPIGLGISTGMSMASVALPMLFSQPNPNDAKIKANKDAINALATCVNKELEKIRARLQVLEQSVQALYNALNIAHNQEIMYLESEMHREKSNLNKCWIHMSADGSKANCEFTDFHDGSKYIEYHRISGQMKKLLANTKHVYSGNYSGDQKKKFSKAVGGLMILYAQYYEDYVSTLIARGVLLIEEAGDQNMNMLVNKWTEIANELNAAYNGAPSDYNAELCYGYCNRKKNPNVIGDGTCTTSENCNTHYCEYDGGDCLDSPQPTVNSAGIPIYTRSGNTNYYLKVCGNNQATSQTSNAGWCEQFYFEPHVGYYGIYTKTGDTKYYLKICGNDNATSQKHIGGWCEQFYIEDLMDGTYGIYTQSGGQKYYLKVCGNNNATSQKHVGGWCEKFYFDKSKVPNTLNPSISTNSEVRMNLRNALKLANSQKAAASGVKTRYFNGKPTTKTLTEFGSEGSYTLMKCVPTSYVYYQNIYATRGTLSKLIQDEVGVPMLSACLSYITPSGYTKQFSAVVGDDRGKGTDYLAGPYTLGDCAYECEKKSGCGGFELGIKMPTYEEDCSNDPYGFCGYYGWSGAAESAAESVERRRLCRRRQAEDSQRRSLSGCKTLDPNGNNYIDYPHKGTSVGLCILHYWDGQKPVNFENSANHWGRVLYTRNSKPNGAALAIEAAAEAEVGTKVISVEAEAPVCNTVTTYGMWAIGIVASIALTRAYYKSSKDAAMHALLTENEL